MKGKTVIEETFQNGSLSLISLETAAGISNGRYHVIYNGWKVAQMQMYKGLINVRTCILGTKALYLGMVETPQAGLLLVKEHISDNPDLMSIIGTRCTADQIVKTARRGRRTTRTNVVHVELSELTADTDLITSDLLSKRTNNILRYAGISTLRQLSDMTRREFLKLRNCGPGTASEAESLLARVGLSWNVQAESVRQLLSGVSDPDLLRECKRRGIISE